MLKRDEEDNEPIGTRLGGLLGEVVTNFENFEHKAKYEAEKLTMVLRLVSDAVQFVNDDEELMDVVLKMAQKMGRTSMGRKDRPTGRPGWNQGNGQGNYGNGQGNQGGWGSEETTYNDWSDWGSESTIGGWWSTT